MWRACVTPRAPTPRHLNLKHMRCAGACISSGKKPKGKSLVVLFCCCTNKQHFTLSVIYPGCANHQSHKILYCWPPRAAHPRARFHIHQHQKNTYARLSCPSGCRLTRHKCIPHTRSSHLIIEPDLHLLHHNVLWTLATLSAHATLIIMHHIFRLISRI